MNPIVLRRSSLLALTVTATLALSSIARAEEARPDHGETPNDATISEDTSSDAGTKGEGDATPNDAKKIVLVVDADEASSIDREALRATLQADLHLPVELRDAPSRDAKERQMLVQLRDGHVALVTYRDGTGRVLSRAIEVTGDRRALASAAALLAENLAHDQTSDLLADAPAASTKEAASTTPDAAIAGAPAEGAHDDPGPTVPVIVSLFYPIATNWGAPNAATPFALDLVFGRNGGIRGAELSGAVGFSSGGVDGAQIAGAANVARDLTGAQIAGAVNVANDTAGLQIAGAANVARDLTGAQIAGAVNVANDMVGAQIGVVNVGGDVDGAQIGVVNVGKHVRGLQLGVVNVADAVDGASYGLASFIKDGRVRGLAWVSADAEYYANAGVEWSSKHAYAIAQGLYSENDFLGAGVRFGARVPIGRFHVSGDVGTAQLWCTRMCLSPEQMKATSGGLRAFNIPRTSVRPEFFANHEARVLLGFDVTSFLSVFAGGGLLVQLGRASEGEVRLAPTLAAGLSVGN